MDKTFAETQGQAPFDWNKWLDAAIEMLPILPHDEDEKGDMAMAWVTCACGNMCAVIPRDHKGKPLDGELADLGASFGIAVAFEDYIYAKDLLEQIEARSAVLISEELKKLNS